MASNNELLEGLLRPPVELWSALAFFASAVSLWLSPATFLLPDAIAFPLGGGFVLVGGMRAWQGFRIVRYHRNLRRLKVFRLENGRIPASPSRLFFGKGFRWTPKHTQRLWDARDPRARRYVEPPRIVRWARRCEAVWERSPSPFLRRLAGLLGRDAWFNPLRPDPPIGGDPLLHGVEPDEEPIFLPMSERVGHILVLGTTRVGKTRLAELLIAQDIRRGATVLVFDPKGDADLMKRVVAEARRARREHALYLFHLGYPHISARYNPVGSFARLTEVATRIAGQLPAEGEAAAFREFAWHFSHVVARALVALGRRPDYAQILKYIRDIEPLLVDYLRHLLAVRGPENWQELVAARMENPGEIPPEFRGRNRQALAMLRLAEELGLSDPVAEGLKSAFSYEKRYFDRLVVGLQPLLEKLTSGALGELLVPSSDPADKRPVFDWLTVIRRGAIVYVGLDALSDFAVSQAVGAAMFADLASTAGFLYKHGIEAGLPNRTGSLPDICVHCDEFNELMGDEFIPMVNKAGGANFQVVAYTQTLADIEAKAGNKPKVPKARQVVGNFNTLVMLRVKDKATAELLTEQLPETDIRILNPVSGVIDASDPTSEVDFVSRNEDSLTQKTVPLIAPDAVMALPRGQAFALLPGGHLYKLRLPLPDPQEADLPQNLEEVAAAMARKYTTAEGWWLA